MVNDDDRRVLDEIEELITTLMDKHAMDLPMQAVTAFSEGLREIRIGFRYMEVGNG